MRYPKFLQPNGTITFVAPSCGCAIEPYKSGFLSAQEKWRAQGYRLELGPNCYLAQGVGISNTPDLCGAELTEYYCNTTGDCIISCGGGELMCEILDYVDFGRIREAVPKWYMGYSDNTNMTFLLATLCDVASIYGPCAASFGMEPRHSSIEDAMLLLTGQKLTMRGYELWEKESLKCGDRPLEPYNLTEQSVIRYLLPGPRTNVPSLMPACEMECDTQETDAGMKSDMQGTDAGMQSDIQETDAGNGENVTIDFTGRLLGGCVDCLVNLIGTKYDRVAAFAENYKEDGILWFLEPCDLTLMGIRRAMWQMEHAGWFQNCSGFLIGRPRLCMESSEFGIDHYQAVCEVLKKYNVPVLMDVDIGHLPPMIPLICGSMAKVVSDGRTYSVEMRLE